MTPREVFGLIVRTMGLGLILAACFDLYGMVVKLAGVESQSQGTLGEYVAATVCFTLMGLVLLYAAERIVTLVYGRRPPAGVD